MGEGCDQYMRPMNVQQSSFMLIRSNYATNYQEVISIEENHERKSKTSSRPKCQEKGSRLFKVLYKRAIR